jgi:alpha-1,6-mannosyltransferase
LPRPKIASDPLLTVAGVGLASDLIYWLIFVRPFPLAGLYDTIPPVDYAKLTGHSVGGAVSFTLTIIALFVGYVIALRALRAIPQDPTSQRWAWSLIVGGAVLFGATLALAYPTTAIDVLIYAVRTRGWALYGLNPLATAPQALPGDPWVGLAAEWADAPSPYGLVWEGLSLLAFRLVSGDFLAHLFALKAITTLAHLGCAGLVALTLRRLKPDWALVGTAAFAWNPLALLESAGNGHNDILMVFFLLLAVYFAASDRRWPRPAPDAAQGSGLGSRGWLVIPALTLSIFTKFIPVMVLPFFLLYLIRQETGRGRRLAVAAGNLALAGGLGVALMAPVWPGWQNWAIRSLGEGAGKSPFTLLVLILRPWLTTNVAFDVSRYLLGGLFLLISLWLAWRALSDPPALERVILVPTFGVFFWYLMLPNQQFHAWYLLWPLAMAVLIIPSSAFTRIVVFGLTALLSITLYETLRVWWWDILTPLVIHAIAIPFVFGLPLLVGIRDCLPWRVGQGRLEIGDG